MLTNQHLQIIRAALQFFDEELSPHGPEAISDYVDGATPENVAATRRLLDEVTVRYVERTEVEPLLYDEQRTTSVPVLIRTSEL